MDPLEFLARVVTHIPDPGQVMQRYYGWYASRTRGTRRSQPSDATEAASVVIVELVDWSLRVARCPPTAWPLSAYPPTAPNGAEHGGTLLDARVHFTEGRHATDQIPLARLI